MKTVFQPPQISLNLRANKVLVVDDFFNFRLTLKNMMRSLNVVYIDEAGSGEEAIKKMSVRKFDIILCDYNLGDGKSGQQVLEEGKFRGYINYSTIFIMVTAENTMDMIMGAVEYQPDDYLIKPFSKEALEKKIQHLIEKKGNFKDIEKAMAQESYTEALGMCDDLTAKSPRNLAEVLKLKGEILLKMGAYKEAADFYDNILLKGKIAWAMLGRGRISFLTGQYKEAKKNFEDIIAMNNKIISAHDYLAQTLLKMNNPQDAQDVLSRAISISPRAILRQKNLGNLAYRNEDYATAETAFKATVEQGKHSCFKSPSDYTSLAKTMVQLNDPEEGLSILENARKVFPEDDEARLHVSLTQSYVYKKMNDDAKAMKTMVEAQKILDSSSIEISTELKMELARAYFVNGDQEKGNDIVKHIVQENHDNNQMLDDIRSVFRESGMEDMGEQIIEETRQEVVSLNNDGVKLVRQGKLTEAISYFEKAAAQLPENKIINANAAQVTMLYMKENGVNRQSLMDAKTYLDRVRKIDENYQDLPMLKAMYYELVPEE
jgi:tetratricopeptide (TPR) repeat protein